MEKFIEIDGYFFNLKHISFIRFFDKSIKISTTDMDEMHVYDCEGFKCKMHFMNFIEDKTLVHLDLNEFLR